MGERGEVGPKLKRRTWFRLPQKVPFRGCSFPRILDILWHPDKQHHASSQHRPLDSTEGDRHPPNQSARATGTRRQPGRQESGRTGHRSQGRQETQGRATHPGQGLRLAGEQPGRGRPVLGS